MPGIIGKKIGMTSIYTDEGKSIACTVIQAGPCVVTQVKTKEIDGYDAIQLAYDEKKEKHTTKAMAGHFKKVGTTPKKKLIEFTRFTTQLNLGDTVTVEAFEKGIWVDVVGTTKGKGFQGVIKRHGFGGVGDNTHGQHDRLRAPGSLGGSSFPARVFKGLRMAGRMGGDRFKMINAQVLKVIPEQNIMLVSGPVPGSKGSYVTIEVF